MALCSNWSRNLLFLSIEQANKMKSESTAIVGLALQHEVAELIVQTLNLDVAADAINPDDPLYGDGLGLTERSILDQALGGSIVGSPEVVQEGLERFAAETGADELIEALRAGRKSSMRYAIDAVHNGEAAAVVSAAFAESSAA